MLDIQPSASAVAPLLCLISILTLLLLFHFVGIFGVLTASCIGVDQIWYTTQHGNRPSAGAFLFVFYLLFVWNVTLAIADWKKSKGTQAVIALNGLAILTAFYVFDSMYSYASFQHDKRKNSYNDMYVEYVPFWQRYSENRCTTYRRFSGRWRVINRKLGHYGLDVPSLWIDLKPWGDVTGADNTWQIPLQGKWRPPYQNNYDEDKTWRNGVIWAGDKRGYWNFDLQGNILVLTSPRSLNEWEKSRVTLQRETVEY